MLLSFGRIGLPLSIPSRRRVSVIPPGGGGGGGGDAGGGGDTGSGGGSDVLLISRAIRLALFDDLFTSTGSLARSALMEA